MPTSSIDILKKGNEREVHKFREFQSDSVRILITMTCQNFERIACCETPIALGRVVCPKPRRASPSDFTNSIVPLRFHIRNDVVAFDSKPEDELHDLILRKEIFETERSGIRSSSPPFFFGSPPCRTSNPLVQDAYFKVEKPNTALSSPSDSSHSRVKYGNKQAAVTIEGFDCRSSRVSAMA